MARTRQGRPRTDWGAYLYLAPAFAFYVVFVIVPLFQTIWTGFFDWNGITAGTWVGTDNYASVFTDPLLREALVHSFEFIVFYAILPTIFALVLVGAIMRVRVRGLGSFRAVLFIPQILPSVVIAIAWRWIYAPDGPLAASSHALGLDALAGFGLANFDTALPALGLVGTWVEVALCLVLFLAGAQRIPGELFDAARVDGAGAVREFFAVTLPHLRGEITVALTLTTIYALRNFDLVWVATGGGPGTSTTVPSYYVYRDAFIIREVGTAAAMAVVLAAVIIVVVAIIQRLGGSAD
jgi:raffinose/stachyose/melibiose transport system permease protein